MNDKLRRLIESRRYIKFSNLFKYIDDLIISIDYFNATQNETDNILCISIENIINDEIYRLCGRNNDKSKMLIEYVNKVKYTCHEKNYSYVSYQKEKNEIEMKYYINEIKKILNRYE